MWPNARISVMGGKQAALVLAQVQKAQRQRMGQEVSRVFTRSSFSCDLFLSVYYFHPVLIEIFSLTP